DRARGGEVGAEGPGQQDLLDVARLEAELAEQDVPARRDRRLGEMQIADRALREEDRVRRVLAAPVQDEHALVADLRQPGREPGMELRRRLGGYEAPGAGE